MTVPPPPRRAVIPTASTPWWTGTARGARSGTTSRTVSACRICCRSRSPTWTSRRPRRSWRRCAAVSTTACSAIRGGGRTTSSPRSSTGTRHGTGRPSTPGRSSTRPPSSTSCRSCSGCGRAPVTVWSPTPPCTTRSPRRWRPTGAGSWSARSTTRRSWSGSWHCRTRPCCCCALRTTRRGGSGPRASWTRWRGCAPGTAWPSSAMRSIPTWPIRRTSTGPGPGTAAMAGGP